MRDRGAGCQCGGADRSGLKFEAGVFLAATGAGTVFEDALGLVEVFAVLAAKGGLATFALEAGMVAMVVIQPHAKKNRRDDQAVDKG